MRVLALTLLLACAPRVDVSVDSPYFRYVCRPKCNRLGSPRARAIETDEGYACECWVTKPKDKPEDT